MILAYYDKISEPYGNCVPGIHEYVYVDPHGAVWAKLVEYAQNQGLDSFIDFSPSFQEIKQEIDDGYPLILSTQLTREGHMITVVGYTDTNEIIVTNDPAGYFANWGYDGEAVKYSWDDLVLVKGAILVRSPEPIPPSGNWIWQFDIKARWGYDYYWQTAPQIWENYVCFTIGPHPIFIKDTVANASQKPSITQAEQYDFMATSAIKDGVFYCYNFNCALVAFDIESGTKGFEAGVACTK